MKRHICPQRLAKAVTVNDVVKLALWIHDDVATVAQIGRDPSGNAHRKRRLYWSPISIDGLYQGRELFSQYLRKLKSDASRTGDQVKVFDKAASAENAFAGQPIFETFSEQMHTMEADGSLTNAPVDICMGACNQEPDEGLTTQQACTPTPEKLPATEKHYAVQTTFARDLRFHTMELVDEYSVTRNFDDDIDALQSPSYLTGATPSLVQPPVSSLGLTPTFDASYVASTKLTDTLSPEVLRYSCLNEALPTGGDGGKSVSESWPHLEPIHLPSQLQTDISGCDVATTDDPQFDADTAQNVIFQL